MTSGGPRVWISKLASAALAAVLASLALPVAANETAYNPRPGPEDVILPMPGGFKMVFIRVPIPGTGYWGTAERIFDMGGDPKKPEPFEVSRSARIGGNFKTSKGSWYLAIGKYEVTIGQYAAVMGEGDIGKGLAAAAELSGNDELTSDSDPAHAKWMARPLHGLGIHDYHEFISRYNTWCLANADCLAAMKRELGGAGFFRLPTELEWEYVARGGESGVRQVSALPFPQSELANYAHVNSRKSLPDEIGKRKPLPGLPVYDIYGNVAELMATPFTMDNGFGSVGGAVIRGGDYTSSAATLRFSYREELAPFRLRGSDNVYVKSRNKAVGIRLMIGSLVKDPEDRGQKLKEIEQEFRCCYLPTLGKAGDGEKRLHVAGRTLATAKELGSLPANRDIELSDSVDSDQPTGFFAFRLDQFGSLQVEVSQPSADLILEVKHGAWERAREFAIGRDTSRTELLEKTMPGTMWLKFYSAKGSETVSYHLRLKFEPRDIAGNIPGEAHDIGVLTERQLTFTDYVGYGDMIDFYKFRIESTGNISIRLLELAGDANVELLSEEQSKLAESVNPRTIHEEIDFPNAKPGVYFVRVYSKDGGPATYKLMLALGAVDTAGDNFGSARDLGVMNATSIAIHEHLGGADKRDFFKFTTTQLSEITVQLSQIVSNVNVTLFDSKFAALRTASSTGPSAKYLDIAREPGDFFIRVETVTNTTNPYYMTIEIRPVSTYCHSELAYLMDPEATTSQFETTISDECGSRFARFRMGSASTAKLALELTQSDANTAVQVKLFRLGGSGSPITFGRLGKGRNYRVEKLEPGNYLARLDRIQGTSANINFGVSLVEGMIDPEPPGQLVREFEDWAVRVDNSGNQKRCIAYTIAKSVSPEGWRNERPYIWLSMQPKLTNSVGHGFDQARFYEKSATIKGTVTMGSVSVAIPISIEPPNDSVLQTMESCNSKTGRCVSIKGLQGLTRGLDLALEGQTSSRSPSVVNYSLRGYQAAIRHAGTLCDNFGIVGNLIK